MNWLLIALIVVTFLAAPLTAIGAAIGYWLGGDYYWALIGGAIGAITGH